MKKEVIIIAVIACCISWAFYGPYYRQAKERDRIYAEILDTGLCHTKEDSIAEIVSRLSPEKGELIKKINFVLISYEGIQTNCSMIRVARSDFLALTALRTFWYDSNVYYLVTAGSWKTQIIVGISALVAVYLIFSGLREYMFTSALIDKMYGMGKTLSFPSPHSQKQENVAIVPIGQIKQEN